MERLGAAMSKWSTSSRSEYRSDLVPFELWSENGWCNQEVVGESHYERAIRSLFPAKLPERAQVDVVADLVPEPTNRHDNHAVAVRVDGMIVGYLPREDARRYQPLLIDLMSKSMQPRLPCRASGWDWPEYVVDRRGREKEVSTFRSTVRIALDEPHLCTPVNGPPSPPHLVLPHGSAIQVSGEEHHLDVMAPFLRPEGAARAYATVHTHIEQLARSTRDLIEVRIDGRRVGQLTPKMSGDLLPVVRHLEERGLVSAVKATVRGNRLKAEVTLYVARAHELPTAWLQELSEIRHVSLPAPSAEPTVDSEAQSPRAPAADRSVAATVEALTPREKSPTEHRPVPPKPTRLRFNPAPGWPAAPGDWEPWPGWQPPADWPPAPADWNYWVGDLTKDRSA